MPLFRKHRKNPIRRDQYGRSLRQQAFDCFREGYKPSEIIKQGLVRAKPTTLYRYYSAWKKRDGIPIVKILKQHMSTKPEFNAKVIKMLMNHLDMTEDEVMFRLHKPWGLAQLLHGITPNVDDEYGSEAEDRLDGALRFINFCEWYHNSPEDMAKIVGALMFLKDGETLVIAKNDGIIKLTGVTKGKASQ